MRASTSPERALIPSAKLNLAATAASFGVFIVAAAIISLLFWSSNSVDRLARERQQNLVAQILADAAIQVGHDQEGITVWDASILQLREPTLDLEWFDLNLGIWMHTYYGHDAAYVLSPANEPLYSMIDGARARPQDFTRVAEQIVPLVARLRQTQKQGLEKLPANQLTPGETDFLVIDGHPSIVSVKPIVSDSGDIEQVPGTEFIHVSVRRLDSDFVHAVREDYGIDDARFTSAAEFKPGERAQTLRSRDGQVVGYFIWQPFRPGQVVFDRSAPVLFAAAALLAAVVFALMRRVGRRTLELQESNAAIEHLAFHDLLTGLPNRALFEDRLNHALAVFRRTASRRVALIFLDLDRFKMVNDTLGHPAGDELIRQFGERLAASVRATDTAARFGGDEFAVIQTDISSVEEVEALCKRIVKAASEPFLIMGSSVHVGVSIGVALAGKDGLDAQELARRADIALYKVKASGRGRYLLFSPDMDEPIRARQTAEVDLRAALAAGDQLSIAYQPTYSAKDGQIAGVEALVRWTHPETGNVPPAVFIPVAEEIGLMEALGEWIIAKVCSDVRDWPIATISINVSPVQLRNPHFATRVIGIISDSEIDPGRIEIEVTETAMLQDAEQCSQNLRLLRQFGLRVALDDFGTGYSSFYHLLNFEVDRVKIDRAFVDKIDSREGGSAIIQAIVDLARSSGMRTTAEGVETDEQRAYLEGVGCDELQGYLLAKPIPAADFPKWLSNLEHEAVVSHDTEFKRLGPSADQEAA